MATFVDRVLLHAQGGDGGNGCASILREKFKPLGGPDGGFVEAPRLQLGPVPCRLVVHAAGDAQRSPTEEGCQ
mgnify:CR=1 FL=1